MNLKEALIALAEGKKVRKENWLDEGEYLYLDAISGRIRLGPRLCGTLETSLTGNDWELYDEPKKLCPNCVETTGLKKVVLKGWFDGKGYLAYALCNTGNQVPALDANGNQLEMEVWVEE